MLLTEILVADGDRREDGVPGSSLQEEAHHGRVEALAAADGPADDVAPVGVAAAVNVGAGTEQQAHDVEAAPGGGEVQR